jgi:hypothetical protein
MSVKRILRQLCLPCRHHIHRSRAAAVEAVADSIAYGGSVSPSRMGRALRSRARPKHSIKRVDRLLGNSHLHNEWDKYYSAVAEHVLRGNARPVLIIDWSGTVRGLYTLAAATPVGGRAIPIYAEVHPKAKYANRKVQELFLRTLEAILGPGRKPIIVADAGFSAPFMNALKALGWDFVIRVRGGVCMRKDPWSSWLKNRDLYPLAQRQPRCLSVQRFSRERPHLATAPLYVRLVLSKKPKRKGPKRPMRAPVSGAKNGGAAVLAAAREPWLLATSLNCDPSRIVALYALRMQIEETFRDVKSHRFGWSLRHVNSRCHKRMTTLLMLASLAMTAVVMIGIAAEARHQHRQFQANTLVRRVLSYFFLGTCIVARRAFNTTTDQTLRLSRNHFRQLEPQLT